MIERRAREVAWAAPPAGWVWVALTLLLGCTPEEAPPFEALSLRDALQADAHAILAMSDDARAHLAARLESARLAQREDRELPEASTIEAILALDERRAEAADDALVASRLDRRDGGSRVRHLDVDARQVDALDGGAGAPCAVSIELDEVLLAFGDPLPGVPGAVVCAYAERLGVTRAEALAGVPAGIVVEPDAGVLRVNPAWIAAFARAGGVPTLGDGVASSTWALGDDGGVAAPVFEDHPSGTSGCGCTSYTCFDGCTGFGGGYCIEPCSCTVCYAGDDHVCICRTARHARSSHEGSGVTALVFVLAPLLFLLRARRRP